MTFDKIISGGNIVDGTGKREPFIADIGIQADQIAAIGDLTKAETSHRISAEGQVVCPGFVDVHVHSEIALLGGRDQFAAVSQGVTTHLAAPDGFGWAPLPPEQAKELWHYTQFAYGDAELTLNWQTLEAYLDMFHGRIPANLYPQVPHCAVRLGVMGWDPRPATNDEKLAMGRITHRWLAEGACSLCLGLDYQPSANADLNELVYLSGIAQAYDAIYAAHIRYRILGRKQAWEETIELAERAGIPVHISHERVDDEVADILERVEKEQIDLTFESYLYPAGMTHLAMMLPMEYQTGAPDDMLAHLENPEVREKSIAHLRGELRDGSQIVGYNRSGRFIGMTLAEAAKSEGKSNEEFAFDLICEEAAIETFVMPWATSPEENERILNQTASHPRMMIASDGVYNIPHPHPRSYGCFVQYLGKFVRERQLVSLKEAIYKMSGFPAERFRLSDRGRIREGLAADIVVFDPDTVADKSTWFDPVQSPVGVNWVFVNGVSVVEDGTVTGQLPGEVLRQQR
ncbi:amidohydrolase family protein [Candidatus Poribacteria bacterium]|nr:amidohydrolase family protein [Candidatus Poribacteria bacterium]